MGSGKKKIEIKRREKEEQRMVTFSKRRQGLFRKAHQLHSLTGADVAVIAFSPAGRPYTHGDPSFDFVIERYNTVTSTVEERQEKNCPANELRSWLDSMQFEACDSIEELVFLRKGLEDIVGKVVQKIGDNFD